MWGWYSTVEPYPSPIFKEFRLIKLNELILRAHPMLPQSQHLPAPSSPGGRGWALLLGLGGFSHHRIASSHQCH